MAPLSIQLDRARTTPQAAQIYLAIRECIEGLLVMHAACRCTRTVEVPIIWTAPTWAVASASMMRVQKPALRHRTKRLQQVV